MKFLGDFLSSSIVLTLLGALLIPAAVTLLIWVLSGGLMLLEGFLWLLGRVPG